MTDFNKDDIVPIGWWLAETSININGATYSAGTRFYSDGTGVVGPGGGSAELLPQAQLAPPVEPAPSPPSVPGIQQPVFGTGSASAPTAASWFPQAPVGTWLPPPEVGFGGNQPASTPVVPPGTGQGQNQPQYGSGSATVPTAASLFPAGTTTPPYPPIVFANIFRIGAVPPPLPSTPSQPPLPPLPTAFNENEPDPEPAAPARRRRAA